MKAIPIAIGLIFNAKGEILIAQRRAQTFKDFQEKNYPWHEKKWL